MFQPSSLVFDPYGTNTANYIPREIHYINTIASRIFALSKGSFFTAGLAVVNEDTGQALIAGQDYKFSQIHKKAMFECGGKAVYCLIRIVNPNVQTVSVEYHAVGGKFESMIDVVLDLASYEDTGVVPAIPYHSVVGWPSTFPPAEHTHPWREVVSLQRMFNAVYGILTNLYRKQHPQYLTIKDAFSATLAAKALIVNQHILDAEDRIRRFEQMSTYNNGDFLITKNTQVPSNYLKYGTWVKIQETTLIGAASNETIGTLISLQAGTNPLTDQNALKVNFWKRTDDDDGAPFTVTTNKTSVNEGQSVTFTINGGTSRSGIGIGYTLTGITSQDIGGASTEGTVFLNSSGVGSLTLTVSEDALEEGIELLRLSLNGYPSIFKQVTIRDTSTSPYYEMYFSSSADGTMPINLTNEGDIIYLIIKSRNAGDDYTLQLNYAGSSVDQADFVTLLPSSVRVRAQLASVAYQIKSDKVTEGNELLNVYACMNEQLGSAVGSAQARVIDRSKSPSYSFYFSSDAQGDVEVDRINEGDSFYLQLIATNTEDGTPFNITHTGTFNAGDFTHPLPNILSIVNGRASFQYTTVADVKTEGVEFIRAILLQNGSASMSTALDILDTSKNPDMFFRISGNRFGTNSVNALDEGQSAFIVFLSNTIADSTALSLVYGGTADSNDFEAPLPANMTVEGGGFFHRFTVKEDRVTEGDQTLTISLQDPSTSIELATYKLTIKDTSVSPTYQVFFSSDQAGVTTLTSFSEGALVYMQFRSNDAISISTHAIDVFIGGQRATLANGDVTGVPPASITLVNGRAFTPLLLRADERTEGDEIVTVSLRQLPTVNSPVVATASASLVDNSRDPIWSVLFSLEEATNVDISEGVVFEGQTIYLVMNTQNVSVGTYFWLNYTQGLTQVADEADVANLPDFLVTTGDRTVVPFTLLEDWTIENNGVAERLVVNIYRDSARANKILTTWVTVVDPLITARFSGQSNGVGSISQVNEGNIAYLMVNGTNVDPSSVWQVLYYIDGELYTVGDNDLVEPLTHQFSFSQPQLGLAIPINPDGIADGGKRLTVQIRGIGQPADLPPMAETFVDMVDTSFGGVTAFGTYRVGTIGTLAIGAGQSIKITLVGGGGAGDLRPTNGGASLSLEGRDGIASIVSFSNVALFTAGGGLKGDVYDLTDGGLGGIAGYNFAYGDALAQFNFREVVVIDGTQSPRDGNFGSTSAVLDGAGAGSIGLVNGTGGGNGSVVSFVVENLTSTVQSFGTSIGSGGASLRQSQSFIWNDGCIIIESE